MIDISKVSYPHLNRLALCHPGPQIALGKTIYWTLKEDGSNIGAYAGSDGEMHYRSLNPPLGVKDRAIILQTALKVAGDMYAGMPEPDMNKAPQVVTEWAIYMARGIFMELMK